MVFEFLFQNQSHKTTRGYYINHDNLMLATPEERKKLVFYFIGQQVPEKLDPDDRQLFLKESQILDAKATLIGGLFGLLTLSGYPYYRSSINPRIFLNVTIFAVSASFYYYIGNSLVYYFYLLNQIQFFILNKVYNVWEPKFVANNKVLDELANKYNFTVFDFAQAKKEAHLKALRNSLGNDCPIINTSL
ncbi:hypothetical protein IMG5_152180 [Ichthyophthirius multifiliis]|uniref:Uncharacterized protein n=1 Tax=Ichthyophthirius multifiliis TaxID=5932 RepID=G0QYU2_ICHMU|nr:hypothetical protein IMG5_152180 [Ichthyophthirius multifiliis]EGR29617.1 hypothetical protein IMG5_152180 [Ichthyophthirius multifiliis]|eukprot:XP_004030853.1 hypothetical protein IMG5_152180 [Ichthyophthirius multifiliis]